MKTFDGEFFKISTRRMIHTRTTNSVQRSITRLYGQIHTIPAYAHQSQEIQKVYMSDLHRNLENPRTKRPGQFQASGGRKPACNYDLSVARDSQYCDPRVKTLSRLTDSQRVLFLGNSRESKPAARGKEKKKKIQRGRARCWEFIVFGVVGRNWVERALEVGTCTVIGWRGRKSFFCRAFRENLIFFGLVRIFSR